MSKLKERLTRKPKQISRGTQLNLASSYKKYTQARDKYAGQLTDFNADYNYSNSSSEYQTASQKLKTSLEMAGAAKELGLVRSEEQNLMQAKEQRDVVIGDFRRDVEGTYVSPLEYTEDKYDIEYYADGRIKSVKAKPIDFQYNPDSWTGALSTLSYSPYEASFDEEGKKTSEKSYQPYLSRIDYAKKRGTAKEYRVMLGGQIQYVQGKPTQYVKSEPIQTAQRQGIGWQFSIFEPAIVKSKEFDSYLPSYEEQYGKSTGGVSEYASGYTAADYGVSKKYSVDYKKGQETFYEGVSGKTYIQKQTKLPPPRPTNRIFVYNPITGRVQYGRTDTIIPKDQRDNFSYREVVKNEFMSALLGQPKFSKMKKQMQSQQFAYNFAKGLASKPFKNIFADESKGSLTFKEKEFRV